LHLSPRFVQLPESRQASRENKMPDRIISVCVEAATQPDDCFGIGIELRLGAAYRQKPPVGQDVPRGKTECLLDVRFGFCPSAKKKLGVPDESMSAGQIAIQRQRLLALSHALSCTIRKN